MALSDYIARIFNKRPVWLYRVTVGAVSYHYTSRADGYTTPNNSPSDEFPSGQVWTAKAIIRGDITLTVKANRSATFIRLPTVDALAAAIIANDDTEEVTVDIWRGFVGDPDDEFSLLFRGRVTDYEPDLLLTTIICDTAISKSVQSSVAQVVQRPCRHAHYFTNADGGGCRLTLSDWQTTETATAASGRSVTVPSAASQDDGYYLAGILEYDGIEYMIENHVGDTLTIEREVAGLADALAADFDAMDPVEEDVLLAPGCNLTIQNCNAFDNLENFGGFNDMTDSPFDGRSIA